MNEQTDTTAQGTASAATPAGITLRYPFTTGAGRTVNLLEMREPKVSDLKVASRFGGNDGEQEVALLAVLCGLVPEDMDNMHLADFRQVQARFRQMLD